GCWSCPEENSSRAGRRMTSSGTLGTITRASCSRTCRACTRMAPPAPGARGDRATLPPAAGARRRTAHLGRDQLPVAGRGARMWSTFDPGTVAEELEVLARHGLNVTRSFFFLPDFMPSPYAIDEACVDRFARFLDLSSEAGLGTIPTFVVGHMSGENWDVAWRQGRDLYADGWMLARQAFFVRSMAERFSRHPAVVGWLLSNEMPLYGGSTRAEYGQSWAEVLIQAIRAAGARQPASTADGAWGIETTGHDNGFRLRDLEPTLDFVGPHVYPMSDDSM